MFAVASASASQIRYDVRNQDGLFATFRLDDQPKPNLVEDYAFFLLDVAGVYADGSTTAGLSFYDRSAGGGMTINTFKFSLADLAGPVLFSGNSASPTLLTFGPTTFNNAGDGSAYTITASAVPEPATWAMLIVGCGFVGGTVRRRQVKAAIRFA